MDENKATSMDEFEKQLKQNIDSGASSLSDFEQQLKQNINPQAAGVDPSITPTGQGGVTNNPQTQTIKVRKNIVLSFPLKYKLVA